jgi:copper chaperone
MTIFNVQGMNCGGCASRVTKAVQGVDPVARVVVDLAHQTVSVDSTIDREILTGALRAAGYPPL